MQTVGGVDFYMNGQSMVDPNDKCIPRFFWKAKHMVVDSEKEGRPIYVQEAFVEIMIPGNAKQLQSYKVTDEHKKRWPRQWLLFDKMGESAIEGTPIDQWPAITVSQVEVLKSIAVPTIEALAGLGDEHLIKLGPEGRQLRERAKTHINMAKDAALVEKQSKRIDELEKQLNELLSMQAPNVTPITGLKKDGTPRKKAGRKPKVTE